MCVDRRLHCGRLVITPSRVMSGHRRAALVAADPLLLGDRRQPGLGYRRLDHLPLSATTELVRRARPPEVRCRCLSREPRARSRVALAGPLLLRFEPSATTRAKLLKRTQSGEQAWQGSRSARSRLGAVSEVSKLGCFASKEAVAGENAFQHKRCVFLRARGLPARVLCRTALLTRATP